MIPMLMNMTMPWAPSMWSVWIQHIMKHKKFFSLKRAAMVRAGGGTASATTGFLVSDLEVNRIRSAFNRSNELETIQVKGKTYVIKTLDEHQLVAFNGTRYMIVCRSRTLFIIVQCDCRKMQEEAAQWLKQVNARLVEKGF